MKYRYASLRQLALLFLCVLQLPVAAVEREVKNLKQWQFSHDERSWVTVDVPHDWAISGPFDKKWDLQRVAIAQDGEEVKTEKSGRTGALPWMGNGTYQTTINLKQVRGLCFSLDFDGAMSEPEVYINEKDVGGWKYGYNAFRLDISPWVHTGKNKIVVRLRNREQGSRWYPGAGLYRPVKLITTNFTHIDSWETYYRTEMKSNSDALVTMRTQVINVIPRCQAKFTIYDESGEIVKDTFICVSPDGLVSTKIKVVNPYWWSPSMPYRYRMSVSLFHNGELIDSWSTHMGLRVVSVSGEGGFMLNGENCKLKGVCLHHDLGPLGAAIDRSALIRQIRLMKEMGANAIRTSHNMPSTMQMEICDSMGMMVMAESFDMWKIPKVTNGYGLYFDRWWKKDLTNMLLRHRNHPCIVMWSIGNEIPEQGEVCGAAIAREMTELCHSLDPTRPVTCGVDKPLQALHSGFLNAVDIPALNYRLQYYDSIYPVLRQGVILGSETASTVSSRGVYKFPVILAKGKMYDDGQCSSYDTECCLWSNLPDEDFTMQNNHPWTIGQFVWTGFDYLGEPTPYNTYWPSRSSYFGICDLAGLPKDRFYLYRSQWNNLGHTLHILPHWTWPGREGHLTPVTVYSDYPQVELFVNGKSQGIRYQKVDKYRLTWSDVVYQPGILKAVACNSLGIPVDSATVKTSGTTTKLRLNPEEGAIGDNLTFVEVAAVDANGNECPYENMQVKFKVRGNARFKCVCNGDATSLESFTIPEMSLFNGHLVVVVEHTAHHGHFTLFAQSRNGLVTELISVKF